MLGISFHPIAHPIEIQRGDVLHPESRPGGKGGGISVPFVAKPGGHPFSSSASGLPTSSGPKKSTMQDIKLANDPSRYAIRNPGESGDHLLFKHDETTDAPIDTGLKVRSDGQGGWEKVGNTDVAQPASHPPLPPAAKIDPKQLGSLKPDGTYPGGDGNSYVRSAEGYHPASYDKQLQSWRINDPERPHDFNRSVLVKMDGKGDPKPLPKAGLKAGGFPKTWQERVSEAEAEVRQAESRHRAAHARWQDAARGYEEATSQHVAVMEQLQHAAGARDRLERQHDQLTQRLRREDNPVRREDISGELALNRQQLASARSRARDAESQRILLGQKRDDAERRRDQAFNAAESINQEHSRAQQRLLALRQNRPPV
jgi:hypothetical protein